jgi:hypothetical protein
MKVGVQKQQWQRQIDVVQAGVGYVGAYMQQRWGMQESQLVDEVAP